MSKSKLFATSLSLTTFGLYGLFIALMAAPATTSGHFYAQQLAQHADGLRNAQPFTSIADYQDAILLDRHNATYTNRLADLYLERNQPKSAIQWLQRAAQPNWERIATIWLMMGENKQAIVAANHASSAQSQLIQAKAYLEAGEYDQATSAAKAAGGQLPVEAQLVEVYCAALQGKGSDAIIQAADNSTNAEVTAAAYGGLPLAYSLYHHGLLASAARATNSTPDTNATKFTLLAAIELSYTPVSKARLQAAGGNYQRALSITPASADLHQQLASVLSQLGDQNGAAQQAILASRLLAGKP